MTTRLLLALAAVAILVALASGAGQRRRCRDEWPTVDGWPGFVG